MMIKLFPSVMNIIFSQEQFLNGWERILIGLFIYKI
jgi:hypothetical protein